MATNDSEQEVKTATEARQGERGPTVRNVLVMSTVLAVIAFGVIGIFFFGR